MARVNASASFREMVRVGIHALLPPEMAERNAGAVHPTREDILAWTSHLARRGWSVPDWPETHGGTGWSEAERQIFEEEALRAGAPPLHIQSISLIGPLICRFGTAEQQQRWLPGIREGRTLWAQGFSEPGAGSDLAALRTSAILNVDHYVVNGQKIWTSDADFCDFIFCLVRTGRGERRQHGISILCFPLNSPGVTVRPISLIDGSHSLCEVFFDDVRVPASSLLGPEGEGWALAKWLLDNERTGTAELPRSRVNLERLTAMVRERSYESRAGTTGDSELNLRIAELHIDLMAVQAAAHSIKDDGDVRPIPSILKVAGTELMQRILDMQVEMLDPAPAISLAEGTDTNRPASPIVQEAIFRRAATIYGGSSEVQRSIIARTILAGDRLAAPDTEDCALVRQSIRLLVQRSPTDESPRAAIARFAEGGWIDAVLDEREGGIGIGRTALFEELGRSRSAGPLLGMTAPLALLVSAGSRWHSLAESAGRGQQIIALANADDGIETRASRDNGRFTISGRKSIVLNGGVADLFIISARQPSGKLSLFLVDGNSAGLGVRRHCLLDGRDSAELTLNGIDVSEGSLLLEDGEESLDAALSRAIPLGCAEAVGTMDEGLWLTRDYLRTRSQFGRPLAEFQVLQHRLADMYASVELCRALVAMVVVGEAPAGAVEACHAKIGAVAGRFGREIIQLHGAIAMTQEYEAGWLHRRLEVFGSLFGGWRSQRARFMRVIEPSDDYVTSIGSTEWAGRAGATS